MVPAQSPFVLVLGDDERRRLEGPDVCREPGAGIAREVGVCAYEDYPYAMAKAAR